MPKISQAYETMNVSLPSYPDSEVQIKTYPSVDDIIGVEDATNDMERSVVLAVKLITKWNFQNEDGTDTPINQENIKQLPALDLQFLIEQMTPLLEKKAPSAKTS